jgi:hypothetical protein
MAPMCAAIELDARTGSLTQAAAWTESLNNEFTAVRRALERAIQ